MSSIFDKVKRELNKGVTTVNVKSKELLAINRLNALISAYQDKRATLIVELGKATFDMFANSAFDESRLVPKCQEIQDLDNKIAGVEAEIADIRKQSQQVLAEAAGDNDKDPNALTCECGNAVSEDMKFCNKCGKKLEFPLPEPETETESEAEPAEPAEPAVADPLHCSCGHVNKEGAKFCIKCGQTLS